MAVSRPSTTRHARLSRAAERRAGIVRDVLVAHHVAPDEPTDHEAATRAPQE